MVALGILAAVAFGGGASMLSGGQRGRDVKDLERELGRTEVAGDPLKSSLTRYRLDDALLSKAAATPKSGFFSKIAFYGSAGLLCNQESSKRREIETNVLKLAAPDLTDKGSLYYLLLKAMDNSTGTKVRTDVAMYLAKQPRDVKDEMIGFLANGRPKTDAEHGSFFSTLKTLGESEVNIPGTQFPNAKAFMLACLKGDQTFDTAAPVKQAAATPVKTSAAPVIKQATEEAPVKEASLDRLRRRHRAVTPEAIGDQVRNNTARFGNSGGRLSWFHSVIN